jgi:UDP-N-acetyl-D-galactosamine dehydrogenase
VNAAKILIMGLTFKENCPDIRNTRVVDIVSELKEYSCQVDVYDPWVSSEESEHQFGITPIDFLPKAQSYDAIIIAVAHQKFIAMGEKAIRALGKKIHVLYDLKYILTADASDLRL